MIFFFDGVIEAVDFGLVVMEIIDLSFEVVEFECFVIELDLECIIVLFLFPHLDVFVLLLSP